MAEPEFEATGVRIGRLFRSLTRAGQVLVRDGRLVLLTSYGSEIDSAPVGDVSLRRPWPSSRDLTFATLGRTRYVLRLATPARERLLAALRDAREQSAKLRDVRQETARPAEAPERRTRLATERRTVVP